MLIIWGFGAETHQFQLGLSKWWGGRNQRLEEWRWTGRVPTLPSGIYLDTFGSGSWVGSHLYMSTVCKKNILVPFYISRPFLLLVREKLGKWCCAIPQLSKSWWLFCPLWSRENCWDLARSWWSHEQSPGSCEHLWCTASLRGVSLKSHLTPKGKTASGTQWMGRKLCAWTFRVIQEISKSFPIPLLRYRCGAEVLPIAWSGLVTPNISEALSVQGCLPSQLHNDLF